MIEDVRSDEGRLSELVRFLAAGEEASGEFRCAECTYGVVLRGMLPRCPMCGAAAWEPTGPPSEAGEPATARTPR